MNTKAQAALEYLVTYGWAFLAILAIIATLIYLGIGDAESNIPAGCHFGPNFPCENFYAIDNGSFAFELTNFQRTTINITNATCYFPDGERSINFNTTANSVGVGDKTVITCLSTTAHSLKGKEKFKVRLIYYYNESGALPKSASGEIIAAIVQGTGDISTYENISIPTI